MSQPRWKLWFKIWLWAHPVAALIAAAGSGVMHLHARRWFDRGALLEQALEDAGRQLCAGDAIELAGAAPEGGEGGAAWSAFCGGDALRLVLHRITPGRDLRATVLWERRRPETLWTGTAEAHFERAGAGFRVTRLETRDRLEQPAEHTLVDIAARVGLDWSMNTAAGGVQQFFRMGGGGIGLADFDRDGDLDVLFTGPEVGLYEALEDGFFRRRPLALEPIDLRVANGVTVTDFDGDGWLDLHLTYMSDRGAQLYRGVGPFQWENVTDRSGLVVPPGRYPTQGLWADYDRDGDLDCYMLNFGDPTGAPPEFILDARNGQPNQLFRNEGEGRFREVTEEAGVADSGWALAGTWFDADRDGHLDLYVVNDYGANRLYRSLGDGRFEDVSYGSGAIDFGAGMGVSVGDVDRDGEADLYVSNIAAEDLWFYENRLLGWRFPSMLLDATMRSAVMRARADFADRLGWDMARAGVASMDGNSLLMGQGGGRYEAAPDAAGAAAGGWGWGNALFDLDNDGDLDLFATNGFLSGDDPKDMYRAFVEASMTWPERYRDGEFYSVAFIGGRSWQGHQRDRLWTNDGGRFTDAAFRHGVDRAIDSRAVVDFDPDGDGDRDLLVTRTSFQPDGDARPLLYENRLPQQGGWVDIWLEPAAGAAPLAIGAEVTVALTDGRSLTAWYDHNRSYLSSAVAPLHFGLGPADAIATVRLRWPSGHQQSIDAPPSRRTLVIAEEGGWYALDEGLTVPPRSE